MTTTEPETSTMIAWWVTFGLFIFTILVVVYYVYKHFQNVESWETYGVKQVKMASEDTFDFRAGCHHLIERHGDTVGISGLGSMMLLTRDLDLLRLIMVKEFNNFVDRLDAVTTISPVAKGLFFQRGQDWKRVRRILSPSFNIRKTKTYSKTVNDSARRLSVVMEEFSRKDQLFPVKATAGQYTGEIIAKLAFGHRIDCMGKEDDDFTRFARVLLKVRNKFMTIVMFLLFNFPKFQGFLVKTLRIGFFDQISVDGNAFFYSLLCKVVRERQEEYARLGKIQPKFNDFLETLMIAKEQGDMAVAEAATRNGDGDADQAELNMLKTLTDEELLGQAMLIIFAGFETVSTTLQMCLYLLAKHPDVQEQVYQEIMATVSSDTPTYEELGQLKYTQQVIDETLRHFPPATFITRMARETTKVGPITILKGAAIVIPLDMIMMNPKLYPDPKKFDPDRFSEENKVNRDPMAFIPFGYGPRICIGMRLAYLELKLALVHVLRKVKVELNDRTEPQVGGDIETRFQGFIVVDKPIMLSIALRSSS